MKASSIEQRAIEWLWWPYVPLGKLSTVAGQMGQAKSLFTLWLAASVTRGALDIPEPGSVIVLSAEDDPDDTTAPRLEAAGADLDRVWIEPVVSLDAVRLQAICDEMPNTRLITIDPVQAYLGTADSWKGQQVRAALEPIRQLAKDRRLAVLAVQHLNRRSDVTDPLARINDSQGIPQLARSVLMWGPDPADEDGDQGSRKALTRGKGNLARSSAAATFTLKETQLPSGLAAPTLVRGTDRDIEAGDVIADNDTRTAKQAAADWLRSYLEDGEPRTKKELVEAADEVGINEITLQRCTKLAGVTKRQIRDGKRIAGWEWLLTQHAVLPPTKQEVM